MLVRTWLPILTSLLAIGGLCSPAAAQDQQPSAPPTQEVPAQAAPAQAAPPPDAAPVPEAAIQAAPVPEQTAPPATGSGYGLELGAYVGAHFFNPRDALGRTFRPDSGTGLQHGAALGLRLGLGSRSSHWLPEAEFTLIPTHTVDGGPSGGAVMALAYRATIQFQVLTDVKLRPFLGVGLGGIAVVPVNTSLEHQDSAFNMHGGIGARYDLTDCIGLRLDARLLMGPDSNGGFISENYEVLAGVYGRFGGGPPAPPPVVDTDGDGTIDSLDKCPTVPGPKENQGCPDVDTDGDGTVDRLDKCPAEAGPKENQGCPDKDTDGDGIVDRLDKCPAEAGPKENQGCPDTDRDADGIVDRLDKCPDQAETKNGYQDEDGCPDEIPQAVQKFTGVIKGINFEPNKAVILPSSFAVLGEAVAVLTEHSDVKLEIQGHTDSVGPHDKNMVLSQQRAEAVKIYMEQRGIADGRLIAVGYGPDKPIDKNTTVIGRSKNRRVEFQLITK